MYADGVEDLSLLSTRSTFVVVSAPSRLPYINSGLVMEPSDKHLSPSSPDMTYWPADRLSHEMKAVPISELAHPSPDRSPWAPKISSPLSHCVQSSSHRHTSSSASQHPYFWGSSVHAQDEWGQWPTSDTSLHVVDRTTESVSNPPEPDALPQGVLDCSTWPHHQQSLGQYAPEPRVSTYSAWSSLGDASITSSPVAPPPHYRVADFVTNHLSSATKAFDRGVRAVTGWLQRCVQPRKHTEVVTGTPVVADSWDWGATEMPVVGDSWDWTV